MAGGGGGVSVGTIVGGDFRIVRPLSSGGMGTVYVAEQISTSRERALKLMLGELSGNDDLKRRFAQEARIGAHIESEHVVEVVGAGVDPALDTPWLAMELLLGRDLASLLAERGALSNSATLAFFEQLTHAMAAAHDKQIVHRDLKPENIFLAQSRRAGTEYTVKVLDFGIAKLLGQARTSATAAMGTPLWMAPEQTQPNAHITPAADIWALGLIAFRCLAGASFWKSAASPNASAMMVIREIAFEPIPTASGRARELGAPALPSGFDGWFARCVHRAPEARFQHAREMFDGLRSALTAAAPRTGPSGTQAAAALTFGPASNATAVGAPLPGITDFGAAGTRPPSSPVRIPSPPSSTTLSLKSNMTVAVGAGAAVLVAISIMIVASSSKEAGRPIDDDARPVVAATNVSRARPTTTVTSSPIASTTSLEAGSTSTASSVDSLGSVGATSPPAPRPVRVNASPPPSKPPSPKKRPPDFDPGGI